MVNYFSYDFDGPKDDEVIKVHTELGQAPWQNNHQLLMIGLKNRRD